MIIQYCASVYLIFVNNTYLLKTINLIIQILLTRLIPYYYALYLSLYISLLLFKLIGCDCLTYFYFFSIHNLLFDLQFTIMLYQDLYLGLSIIPILITLRSHSLNFLLLLFSSLIFYFKKI